MSKLRPRHGLVALLAAACVAALQAQSPSSPASGYQLPPKVIVDILDAAPTPTVVVSPNRQTVALLERRSMPSIADLAEPIHRLAGAAHQPEDQRAAAARRRRHRASR